jgi:hypothetical protein
MNIKKFYIKIFYYKMDNFVDLQTLLVELTEYYSNMRLNNPPIREQMIKNYENSLPDFPPLIAAAEQAFRSAVRDNVTRKSSLIQVEAKHTMMKRLHDYFNN